MPWSQVGHVSGKSPYVDEVASALEQVAVVVRQDVENKRFVRSFCDKAVGVVISRFTHNIVKLKPISRSTAEQVRCARNGAREKYLG